MMNKDFGVPTFLPVMNVCQKLMAIQPDFGAMQTSEWIAVLQSWKEKEFFDTLGSIVWMLAVKDIHEVPTDLHTRLPASKFFFCIPDFFLPIKKNQPLLNHSTTTVSKFSQTNSR